MMKLMIMHVVLIMGLSVILSLFQKKFYRNIFITFPLALILCIFSNYHLNLHLFVHAIINIIIYAMFIRITFQHKFVDAIYLSVSYWICIELIDLLQQFIDTSSLNTFFVYALMYAFVTIIYIPFLFLDKLDKKIPAFILPATLCLFMMQALNDKTNDFIILLILVGLFVSNICYLYFYASSIKSVQLEEEKRYLKKELELVGNNYDSTFSFIHTLIHDNQLISEDFEKGDYRNAKNHFKSMNEKAIRKFNSLYTGNTSLSIALLNVNIEKVNVQYFVGCDLDEFKEDDLTLFFLNTLKLINCYKEISVIIKSCNENKIISFKVDGKINNSEIEKMNSKFIKKYKLKIVEEDNCLTFIHLSTK